MDATLACDKFWVNKSMYHEAEKTYYEGLAKLHRRLEISGRQNEDTGNQKVPRMKDSDLRKYKKSHVGSVQADSPTTEVLAKTEVDFFLQEECFISSGRADQQLILRLMRKRKKTKTAERNARKKIKNEKKPKRSNESEGELLGGVGMTKIDQETFPKTSLAGEVAKARQHIKSSLECMESVNGVGNLTSPRLTAILEKMEKAIENLTKRVEVLERECATCRSCKPVIAVCPAKPPSPAAAKPTSKDDDDDVDLFGSESEEDEEAKKVREQRLAEYASKKSKKPGPIAKSNIILDIKPWDDETDMQEMEKAVRAVEMDGLLWGASKLVPVAFKIFKLQISCVVEDDKVSVDLLTETLEKIEDYIQSVDIAAFNKV